MSNTRTLSSVLAELLKTQSSTDDHIIVTSGGKTYYVTPAELPTANSEQNGQMSKETYNTLATQVVRIDEINGKLGEPFDRLMIRYMAVPNCETIDKFNLWINVSLKNEDKQGLSIVPVYGIPMLVMTAQTNKDKNMWMQTLFGCVSLSEDKMSIAEVGTYLPYVQLVRYFNKKTSINKWDEWESINPSAQTAVAGTDKNYVYSQGKSEDTKTLITSKFWIYQHTDGNMFFRVKHWGAANDKEETDYSQVMIPNAWVGANGLIRRDVYSRLDSFALREENSTATQVNIVTPIFTTGGTRTFSISRATSAKAGVMSAEDKTKLDKLIGCFTLNSSHLPTEESGSNFADYLNEYANMARIAAAGGNVRVDAGTGTNGHTYVNLLDSLTVRYVNDTSFRLTFEYKGKEYFFANDGGNLKNSITDITTTSERIEALEARVATLEQKIASLQERITKYNNIEYYKKERNAEI